MKVSTVAEMRAMDGAAIEKYGIVAEILMENAGAAAYRLLAQKADLRGQRTVVVCGGGNNGGDGLVVARHIASAGGSVTVLLMSDPAKYTGAAALNYDIAGRLGIDIKIAAQDEQSLAAIQNADVVIDALLGTGIERPVEGLFAKAIELINESRATVLSIDIPSGINGDTGQVMGSAVRADRTVTFGLPKMGNLLYPGWQHGGDLCVSHISFPYDLYNNDRIQMAINVPTPLPPRSMSGHKGSFGQALFIAGAANYYGAPYLSAMSFLKAGGGYARLAAPAQIVPTIAAQGCEIVFVPAAETESGSLAARNVSDLLALIERMDFVVIGPGISLHADTQQLVREIVEATEKPLLIDGDGISAVQDVLDRVRTRSAPTVLTPHMGELARITGLTVAEIEADRVAVLRKTCRDLGAAVAMKGAHSLIGYADGRVYVNMTGNSGMATAGSGDVLTGSIAAMYGLGLPFDEAVRNGVFAHGLSGDLAAAECGEDGLTATDILAYLPEAMKLMREGGNSPVLARYLGPTVV